MKKTVKQERLKTMTRKIVYIILTFLTLLVIALLVILLGNRGAVDYKARCDGETNISECLANEAFRQSKQVGPTQALRNMEEYFTGGEDDLLCHDTYHIIGALYYKEYKEQSYIPQVNACYGAYYHGIILENNSTYDNSIENYAEDQVEFCSGFTQLDFFYCIHGIGHGAYHLVDGDSNKALDICKETRWETTCAAGLFMEIIDDPTNAVKYDRENFDNFQVKDCIIFTDKTLNIACQMETHLDTSLAQGKNLTEACSLVNENSLKECKFYYGISLATSIYAYKIKNNIEDMATLENNLTASCKEDTVCFDGYRRNSTARFY